MDYIICTYAHSIAVELRPNWYYLSAPVYRDLLNVAGIGEEKNV